VLFGVALLGVALFGVALLGIVPWLCLGLLIRVVPSALVGGCYWISIEHLLCALGSTLDSC
jgi:hypothetical protein